MKSFSFILLFLSLDCAFGEVAKNVILFIGDGMGPAQITGARLFKGGSAGKLHMESLPITGITRTYSTDLSVTDSAAAATALATGVKSFRRGIGMTDAKVDPKGKSRQLQTLFDLAKKEGKSLGAISTTTVTHATLASFYAHTSHRDDEQRIADQIQNSGLQVLLGGGRGHFLPNSIKDSESGATGLRKDGKNLLERLQIDGWKYLKRKDELKNPDPNAKYLGLFNHVHIRLVEDRKNDKWGDPSLSDMINFSISVLAKNPKGFFLVVEGGRIDHAAHGNNAFRTFQEVLDFDDAIEVALRRTTKKNTLIVVTADHETSGLAISGYAPRDFAKGNNMFKNLKRSLKNDDMNTSIISWASGPGTDEPMKADNSTPDQVNKALYPSIRGFHTAVDVPVMARGPGQNLFTGFMNNNEIAWKIAKAMGTNFTSKVNHENYLPSMK